ncbi:MAG TPA: sigma-70 family RNA polymerase sigma factor [Thermomicrobiales bacterium]|nr:sigma-70 family RNA polymerase sigma factor [Thermomicrobiales bacterium]
MGRWDRLRKKGRTGEGASDDDRAALFAALYDEYVDSIYRYCRVRIDNPAEAEDAAALVFTKAFAAFSPDDTSAIRSWLFTIAHNVVVDHYRAHSAHRIAHPLENAHHIVDPAMPPDELASLAEERHALRAALETLPPDQQRVIELRLAGLTGPEIAETLDRSHGAVKMLQLRAVNRLRELLAPPTLHHPPKETEEIGHGSRAR